MNFILLISIFVIATCGLIYELVAGTLASYLLGDSITQFSTIIGAYLFSMGIGSFLSKYFHKDLISWFIKIEILIGLVGGSSSTILFMVFEHVESFRIILYLLVMITGTLVGLEIPILMRICHEKSDFKEMVADVFTFDYIGALIASVLFPLCLVPFLGLIKTSFLFGIFNVAVALLLCYYKQIEIPQRAIHKVYGYTAIVFLVLGFVWSDSLMTLAESTAYADKVIFAKSSPYQRIVLTRNSKDVRLYLNNNLQFSSADEYRYHEALVHPAMQACASPQNILILGGGDGLAAREVLKYESVQSITLVDLDAEITKLFSYHPMLVSLNQHSLNSPKIKVINADAFEWLKNNSQIFDCIIIDFPDPSNFSIGKLYSQSFYKVLHKKLTETGIAVIQSTSPMVAKQTYWCINNTLTSVGFQTLPYHCFVPSFGDWGYFIVSKKQFEPATTYKKELKFIDDPTFRQMCVFPKDMRPKQTEINKLNNQILVHYFEHEWSGIH